MRCSKCSLAGALLVVVVSQILVPSTWGRALDRASDGEAIPLDEARLRYDPPEAHLRSLHARSSLDTVWFGGLDPATGTAIRGGVWDFEDGTLQGWTSVDLTDTGSWFR